MVCAGSSAYIVGDHAGTIPVHGFTPDLPTIEYKVINCVFLYQCPYSDRKLLLLAQNALHVPSMKHNLIHPFILREAGVVVNEVPKIQQEAPTEEHHLLYFPRADLRIPLSLSGVFSCFKTQMPTFQELHDDSIPVVQLTPTTWDPNSNVFSRNESLMVDWQGGVVLPRDQPRAILDDPSRAMISSLWVNACDSARIDSLAASKHVDTQATQFIDPSCSSHSISNILDVWSLAADMDHRHGLFTFAAEMGATTAFLQDDFLFPEANSWHFPTDLPFHNGDYSVGAMELEQEGTILLSALQAHASRGVKPHHLAKVWRIPLDTARRTIDATSQRYVRMPGSQLSRHFSTDDRALRYRRVHELFFTDTFFAAKKLQSTCGNTCMQLFVTNKGFLYVVPMAARSEVLQALKIFTKAVGAPDAIVVDPSGEQTSNKVKGYLFDIGTDLRVLVNTQWANRAELYIGLLKESVRRDMSESHCPLVLWDYCTERRARIHNLTAGTLFQNQSRTPHESIFHEEGDLSNLCQYKWYQWIYYRENASFPVDKMKLGRALGPANGEGNEMCQWVLNHHGNVLPRRSHRPLTHDEIASESEKLKRKRFDDRIKARWGDSLTPPTPDADYDPEIDVSPELKPTEAAHYQSLIGILHWIVELGRIDIACEVSMMSSHLALPREGHLTQVYHIFAYLKKHHNAELVYDPTVPPIDRSLFQRKDWSTSEAAFDSEEVLPLNRPEPCGLGFVMRAYVDADHATDTVT